MQWGLVCFTLCPPTFQGTAFLCPKWSLRLPALPSHVLPLPTAPVHPLDLGEAVTTSMPSP